ncbi:MAG: hypothetical protein D6730_02135 [Bacteroidetes bacterium]|nr:MAG: hypothetical protein D6730_02135 [Bacteroidota bacterium]
MKQKFTDDDIIRFLYDEMEQGESERFLDALCSDEDLWERYEYFQEIVEKTAGLSYEPSEYSCQQIMAYVAVTSPQPEDVRGGAPYLAGLKGRKLSTNAILMFVLALFGSITIIGSVYQMHKIQQESQHTEANFQEVDLRWDAPELDTRIHDAQNAVNEIKNLKKLQ